MYFNLELIHNDILKTDISELSGGQKRRVAIAGVIVTKPEILALDEPAAGLDPIGREDLLAHISRYREETNAAIVIVSHSMEDIAEMADRVIVMNKSAVAIFLLFSLQKNKTAKRPERRIFSLLNTKIDIKRMDFPCRTIEKNCPFA